MQVISSPRWTNSGTRRRPIKPVPPRTRVDIDSLPKSRWIALHDVTPLPPPGQRQAMKPLTEPLFSQGHNCPFLVVCRPPRTRKTSGVHRRREHRRLTHIEEHVV